MSELYRKISVRMWGDADFRKLSAPQPNARDLWIFLLTGLHTTPVPGLFAATKEGLAAALKWRPEAFREALAELYPEGYREGYPIASAEGTAEAIRKRWLEADWDAGVVWIAKAFGHNEPQSPKVVIGWKKHVDLIPECELKDKAIQQLMALCYGKGKAFGEAFGEAFGKPIGKATRYQEQEQEQEQEKGGTRVRTRPPRAPAAPAASAAAPPFLPSRGKESERALQLAVQRLSKDFGHDAPPAMGTREQRQHGSQKIEALVSNGVAIEPAAERVARAAFELLAAGKARSFGFALTDCVLMNGAHVNGTAADPLSALMRKSADALRRRDMDAYAAAQSELAAMGGGHAE